MHNESRLKVGPREKEQLMNNFGHKTGKEAGKIVRST